MKKNIIITIIVAVILLIAFYPLFQNPSAEDQRSLENLVPKDIEALSNQYFSLLKNHDFEGIEKNFDPKLKAGIEAKNESVKNLLEKLVPLIPSEEPKHTKTVEFVSRTQNDTQFTTIASEYEFSTKWLMCQWTFEKKNNQILLGGFKIFQLDDSLEHMNRFTFEGKRPINYIVFISAVLELSLVLYTLALCIKMPPFKRKWLWIIIIFLGLVELHFNWTTGAFDFGTNGNFTIQFLSIHFPPAQFVREGFYGPYYMVFILPLGALAFLFKRRKMLRQKVTENV